MLKKPTLFVGGLFLLLVASGFLFIKSEYLSDKVRRFAEAHLTRALNQPVAIGHAALTLFSPSVILTDVTLHGEGQQSSFHADKIRTVLSPWSFLTQSWVIREVAFHNPSLSLHEAAFQLTSQNRSVIIRKIKIYEGTLSYTKGQNGLFLPHLNATLLPDLEMNHVDVSFSGKEGHFTLFTRTIPITHLEGRGVGGSKEIRIEEATVTLSHARADTKGVITFSNSKRAALDAIGLDLQVNAALSVEEVLSWMGPAAVPPSPRWVKILKTLSGPTTIQGLVRGTASHPEITGNIAMPHLAIAGPKPDGIACPKCLLAIGSLMSDISYKDRTITFKKIMGDLFSGQMNAHAALHLDRGEKSVTVHYDQIAGDDILPLFPDSQQPAVFLKGKRLKGQFSLSGEGTTWTTSGTLAVSPQAPVKKVQWEGTGSEHEITFKQAEILLHDGVISFPGVWHAKNGLHLRVLADSRNIQSVAEAFKIPVSGRLHLTGTLTGSPANPFFSGQVQLNDGALKEHPFGLLQSDFSYLDKTLVFQNGSVESVGGAKKGVASGSGIIRFDTEPAYYIAARARAVNPQEVISFFTRTKVDLSTTASGELIIQGRGKRLTVSGPLTVGSGTLYGESFQKGELHLMVTEQKVVIKRIRLENENILAHGDGEIAYDGAYRINATASAQKLETSRLLHAYDLSGNMRLNVSGKGTLKDPQLKFTAHVEKLQYDGIPMGSGTLHLDWKGNVITASAVLPSKPFSFSGQLRTHAPHPFSFQTEFDHFPIHPFLDKTESFAVSGVAFHASGKVAGQGVLDRASEMDLTSRLTLLSARKGDYHVANTGPIEINAQKGVFTIKNGAFKGANTDVVVTGGLTPLHQWGLRVKGKADIGLLRFFTPQVQSGYGVAHLDLRITDQWAKPKMQGILSLQEGTIHLPQIAQPVAIDSLTLLFNQQRLILESVRGMFGRGQFVGMGKAAFSGLNLTQFDFNVEVQKIPVMWASQQTAVVDGTLLFRGNVKKQVLEGTLHLREAVYTKRIDFTQMLSDWQSRKERLPVEIPIIGSTHLNIHLYGKDKIAVENNIVKVALEVDLQMKGTLDHPLLLGYVNLLKGGFRFRSSDFKVTSGTVQFLDSGKIDPIFEIHGESRVRNYILDLTLQGVLSQFTLHLASSPSLPRADILSLLATGKTTQEISGAGEEAREFIVSDLVVGYLAEPIQQLFGVTVGASSSAKGTKSSKNGLIFVEKRFLNDKLVVVSSRALDTAEEESILLFYELNKNVSLGGGRDEDGQMGGDLRFRFEFR